MFVKDGTIYAVSKKRLHLDAFSGDIFSYDKVKSIGKYYSQYGEGDGKTTSMISGRNISYAL